MGQICPLSRTITSPTAVPYGLLRPEMGCYEVFQGSGDPEGEDRVRLGVAHHVTGVVWAVVQCNVGYPDYSPRLRRLKELGERGYGFLIDRMANEVYGAAHVVEIVMSRMTNIGRSSARFGLSLRPLFHSILLCCRGFLNAWLVAL